MDNAVERGPSSLATSSRCAVLATFVSVYSVGSDRGIPRDGRQMHDGVDAAKPRHLVPANVPSESVTRTLTSRVVVRNARARVH
jgi:hypothetical protein